MAKAKTSASSTGGKTLAIKTSELILEKAIAEVVVCGERPLLTHNPDAGMAAWIAKKAGEFKDILPKEYNPEEEWQKGLYPVVDGDSQFMGYGIRAVSFKRTIYEATRGIPRINKTELQCSFYVPGRVALIGQEFKDFLLIESPMPKPRMDRVRLSGKGRTTDDRWRPEFWPWKVTVPIIYYPAFIKLEVIIGLLRRAGEMIGVGDGRNWLNTGRFVLKQEKAVKAA